MIQLTINVASEPLRPSPDALLLEWIDAQARETLQLSAITLARTGAGVAMMRTGKRQRALQDSLETRVLPLCAGRVQPFGLTCTLVYAELIAKARKSGLAISAADGYIAATAAANRLAVARRDTGRFEVASIGVVNPWKA